MLIVKWVDKLKVLILKDTYNGAYNSFDVFYKSIFMHEYKSQKMLLTFAEKHDII